MKDLLATWDKYPTYLFVPSFIGPPNSTVFKFSECSNSDTSLVYKSPFWKIYSVSPTSIKSTVAGFVFIATGEIHRFTTRAISSLKMGMDYSYIESLTKTKEWSSNGLDLIKYESAGEVITDLCTVMGIDVTIDLEDEK